MENKNNLSFGKAFVFMLVPSIIIKIVNYVLSMMALEFTFVKTCESYSSGGFYEIMNDWYARSIDTDLNTALSIGYSIACILIFGSMYLKHCSSKDKFKHCFKGISDNNGLFILGAVIFVIGLQYVCNYLLNTVAATFPSWLEEYEALLESVGLDDSISFGMAIYAIILGPICEELAFRGLTFSAARKIFPLWGAIVAQALLFAFFHGNMLQGTYTFVVGLAFGYIMYRYDNLVVTIILHIGYNLVGTFAVEYLPMGGNTLISYFFWTLGSLIVAYIGLLLLQKAAPGVKINENPSDN